MIHSSIQRLAFVLALFGSHLGAANAPSAKERLFLRLWVHSTEVRTVIRSWGASGRPWLLDETPRTGEALAPLSCERTFIGPAPETWAQTLLHDPTKAGVQEILHNQDALAQYNLARSTLRDWIESPDEPRMTVVQSLALNSPTFLQQISLKIEKELFAAIWTPASYPTEALPNGQRVDLRQLSRISLASLEGRYRNHVTIEDRRQFVESLFSNLEFLTQTPLDQVVNTYIQWVKVNDIAPNPALQQQAARTLWIQARNILNLGDGTRNSTPPETQGAQTPRRRLPLRRT